MAKASTTGTLATAPLPLRASNNGVSASLRRRYAPRAVKTSARRNGILQPHDAKACYVRNAEDRNTVSEESPNPSGGVAEIKPT